MNCIRTDLGSEARLEIDGALDALTVPDIRPVIDALIADEVSQVTVDLSKVSLVDSSGVGAIVSLFKRLKARGGNLTVVGAHDQPLAVLKLLRLDRVFGL